MSIAEVAIRRPIFMTCLVLAMLAVGTLSYFKMPVDQFPDVKLPYVMVSIVYPGAGPEEVANLIAKPAEEELRTIAGVDHVVSFNNEGVMFMWAAFALETDPMEDEQQVRAKISLAQRRMPKEIEAPIIQRHDVQDQAVITLSLEGPRSLSQLYELADRELKPKFAQVAQVSQVKIFGGSPREIQVLLERDKLREYEVSVSQVGQALEMGGMNIPLGKRPHPNHPGQEWIYRSLGEFDMLPKIEDAVVKFVGNDIPTRVKDLGRVKDAQADETSRAFYNGQPAIILDIFRQSGANTVAVADKVKARMQEINKELETLAPGCKLNLIRDGAQPIRANLRDVEETIGIGILLTVVVVFFFLGSLRSTLITGVAIPNSLIGAFVVMAVAGFSVNILTLLALSLAVGLLIDDAIVVRENIFRHMEMGKPPRQAAIEGTREVMLAVVATTLAVMAVFGPIAFVGGITGRFLREFGLSVCFIMAISLFDALTMGPMLSAHFGGQKESGSWVARAWEAATGPSVRAFDRVQAWLERVYERVARFTVRFPGRILLLCLLLVTAGFFTLPYIPKTFLPPADNGELLVSLELEPGATLDATQKVALQVDSVIRQNPEIYLTDLVIGGDNENAVGKIYVRMKPIQESKIGVAVMKERLRRQLAGFKQHRVTVSEYEMLFGGSRPFVMKLFSNDNQELEAASHRLLARMRQFSGFVEPEASNRSGKPEWRLRYDDEKSKQLGVTTNMAGAEVRAQIEGITPAKFRQNGEEWDIRVRLREEDRELSTAFSKVLIPNVNYRLVNLSQVARLEKATGFTTVNRQNSQRMIWIEADLGKGYGVGDLMGWIRQEIAKDKTLLGGSVQFMFEGEGEQYEEMASSMGLAAFMAVLFIYLVLASLYESFVTPFTLLLPLPLAVSGGFVALWLAGQSLNIYSIIGSIMLLGIAAKNSILLVDYTQQLIAKGRTLKEALVEAGKTRLRPILMTSMALIAGTLPVAIGLNEASKQRSSMGWVIIGGIVSSTLLTLVVVPAVAVFFRRKRNEPARPQPAPAAAEKKLAVKI